MNETVEKYNRILNKHNKLKRVYFGLSKSINTRVEQLSSESKKLCAQAYSSCQKNHQNKMIWSTAVAFTFYAASVACYFLATPVAPVVLFGLGLLSSGCAAYHFDLGKPKVGYLKTREISYRIKNDCQELLKVQQISNKSQRDCAELMKSLPSKEEVEKNASKEIKNKVDEVERRLGVITDSLSKKLQEEAPHFSSYFINKTEQTDQTTATATAAVETQQTAA